MQRYLQLEAGFHYCLFAKASASDSMGASEGMPILSLRTLNTVTVTLALGLVALAGWHVQNPGHFEQIQVPRRARSPPRLHGAPQLLKCCGPHVRSRRHLVLVMRHAVSGCMKYSAAGLGDGTRLLYGAN
jgi:hypothetical protein